VCHGMIVTDSEIESGYCSLLQLICQLSCANSVLS
jgi:hypothetical protein